MRVMLSERRTLPKISDLKVTNLMNREAIQQVGQCCCYCGKQVAQVFMYC